MRVEIGRDNVALAAKYKSIPVKVPSRKQSGVIPYIIERGKLRVMLINTRHENNWGIPKGGVEAGMTKRASAAKEAYEEAGIRGTASDKLGDYQYVKGKTGRSQVVHVYAMLIDEQLSAWPEREFRQRKLFSVKDAKRALPKAFAPMLDQLKQIVSS